MSIHPTPDNFESEIDAAVAELREQCTNEDRVEVDRWLNTELAPETSARIDAELEAFFDSGGFTDLPPLRGDADVMVTPT